MRIDADVMKFMLKNCQSEHEGEDGVDSGKDEDLSGEKNDKTTQNLIQ